MGALWGIFIPPEDGVSKKGFTEKVPLMLTLEKWVGLTSGTRRKSVSGRAMSTSRSMEVKRPGIQMHTKICFLE